MSSKTVSTRMSASEIVVVGLAAAVLMSGFATGVFAKQAPAPQQISWQSDNQPVSVEQRHPN